MCQTRCSKFFYFKTTGMVPGPCITNLWILVCFNMKTKSVIVNILCLLNFLLGFSAHGLCQESQDKVKNYTVRIIGEIPHQSGSFTQGLLYYKDKLYESTGLTGKSSLRRINARTGTVEKIRWVPGVFAEGLARWDKWLIQLTWKDRVAFIYDISDFSRIGTFTYETQGWGLTADSSHLIMSDGSDKIYFRNPESFVLDRVINISYLGMPLGMINELEYVNGYIYANIWQKQYIVQIDPMNGNVTGHIDCKPLFQRLTPLDNESVLNGIAYNEKNHTFYLTGKNWPTIFEVSLVPQLSSG